ncbi:MAG: hypothetical protein M3010_00870 [Candidatus Dormibacteraeota bacterium]|nr:hypothetical protein [Candidatus Dormibacteraeota bacterium]
MSPEVSDKLKAILEDARARAQRAQAAAAAPPNAVETNRVEALLGRDEALPDPRALARLYREKGLAERLPDDEGAAGSPVAPAENAPPVYEAPGSPGSDRVPPARPPLSPAQIREVMSELQEQFTPRSYLTFEAKPLPEDVIPMAEDDPLEPEAAPEPSERFYLAGALIAMVVIGIFVVLALNGPLRYKPPPGGPTPSPSASARH